MSISLKGRLDQQGSILAWFWSTLLVINWINGEKHPYQISQMTR